MSILSWILFGLIAGAVAKFIMPGKDPGGCLGTVVIGIAGALLGGFISTELLDWGTVTGWNWRSFAIAVAGSLLLLLVYRLIARRRA